MTKRVTVLCVLAFLSVCLLATAAQSRTNQIAQYSFLDRSEDMGPLFVGPESKRGTSSASLGAFTADGGSPGYIIGRTYRDDQGYANPGRRTDWYDDPHVHHTFGAQALPGEGAGISQWVEYTMFDPTIAPNGAFLSSVWLQSNPLVLGGQRSQLDMDTSGHAVIVCETFNPATPDEPFLAEAYYDVATPSYGTFISSQVPNTLSTDLTQSVAFPKIEWQTYNGQTVTHLVCYEEDPDDPANSKDHLTYWRKVGDLATGSWTTQVFADSLVRPTATITSSHVSGKVAITFCEFVSSTEYSEAAQMYYVESTDMGATWGPRTSIIPFNPTEDGWMGWLECAGLYDSEDYLHAAWYANEFIPPTGSVGRACRIFHWSERSGVISTVHIADFNPSTPCGVGGYAVLNVAKVVISECNGRLYTIWNQYGYPDRGDTLDCADDAIVDPWQGYNAEIYLSVSSTLDGLLWDAARNLTNSKTPGCDGTNENNCDSDIYGTMARYGMNTAAYGTTYWDAVPEAFAVRDVLAPGYADDGWYLDLQYINDLCPDEARRGAYGGGDAIWTYNPVKWFRLPCVEPVIEPRIHISQDDFTHPVYWVKSGEGYDLDLTVENLGNAELQVTNIVQNPIQGPAGWLTINTTALTIGPASSDIASLTIAPITPPAGTSVAIEAEVIISSNDLNAGDYTYIINTVVTDTVLAVVWDTVTTGLPMALTVANNGNAGNVGVGSANMDFSAAGECDPDMTVYLYDLCPVVMQSTTNYSWGPFWQTTRTDTVNFQPVPGGKEASHASTPEFEQAGTGTFVTADSAIGCNKYWVAPVGGVAYVIERWDVYSFDGGSYTGVGLGEWIDWDTPSANESDNEGGFVIDPSGTDYLWQRGLLDPAPDEPPCTPEDLRYGASGLLGYYTSTEHAADAGVNHSDLFGGGVCLDEDLFESGSDDTFIPDSAWARLNDPVKFANNDEEADQQIWLSYGLFDITPGDTITIWTVHASIYSGDETDLQALIDDAEAWYLANREDVGATGCCGKFTDPAGYTGNTNCSTDGKITLSDITALIDHVYISKLPLCCQEAGNTNGSVDGKVTLSDITRLIDRVYISKGLTEPCM